MKRHPDDKRPDWSAWITRAAFTLVFAINLQCALSFCLAPADFAGAYELSGASGEAAVRGIGVAFLMWNATYPAFIVAPRRFPELGWVIIVQQFIGLVGESTILASLPEGHETLALAIERFIAFDGAGLVIMAAAFCVMLLLGTRASQAPFGQSKRVQ